MAKQPTSKQKAARLKFAKRARAVASLIKSGKAHCKKSAWKKV